MADKRAFAKFDVGYLDNPKMMDILDQSCNAILMHFASVLYCSQHLTDGVVASRAMQRKTGGTDDDAQLLIESGLWHDENHTCDSCPQPPAGKVYVHDFLEHNREAAQAKRVSQKRSEAAKARWDKEKEPMQIALQTEGVSNAEREREKERETTSSEPAGSDVAIIDRPDVDAIIQALSAALTANDVKHRIGKNWHTEGRRLLDIDGYTVEQVIYVIRYATNDSFWKTNILSMPKLREKFEALKIKARAEHEEQYKTSAAPSQVAAQHGWAN